MKVTFSVFSLWFFCISLTHAAELYVPDDYPDIQSAVESASNGDTILLAPGNYTGYGNKFIDIMGKEITIQSETGPEMTVIDCQYYGYGFHIHHGETNTTRIIGLTIRNGYADGAKGGAILISNSSPEIRDCHFTATRDGYNAVVGGGICCSGGSPTIINCRFQGLKADYYGGAIRVEHGADPTIDQCIFTNCIVLLDQSGGGGAISFYNGSGTVSNCTFFGNQSASHGGALYCEENSTPTVVSSFFQSNHAARRGGAVFMKYEADLEIRECFFLGNSAGLNGGAIQVNAAAYLAMYNSAFKGNSSYRSGGGIKIDDHGDIFLGDCLFYENEITETGFGGALDCGGFLHMTSCWLQRNAARCIEGNQASGGGLSFRGRTASLCNVAVVENQADTHGGGIYLSGDTSSIKTCTIANNECNADGSNGNGYGIFINNYSTVTMNNSIIWNTELPGQEVYCEGDSVTIDFSNIRGGWSGAGDDNISDDPSFCSGPFGSYHLDPASTSINAGSCGASLACFPYIPHSICMDEFSTLPDLSPDIHIVDLGYHSPLTPPTFTPGPPTATPTPTPTPTDQTPSPTPTLEPTLIPTVTITPALTPSPTITPTPIPTAEILETGVRLEMPSHLFNQGDPCYLKAYVANAEETALFNQPVFVVLDVFGAYWFAPDWIPLSEGISWYTQSVNPGVLEIEVIPLFYWPENIGSGSDIVFWGAMTNHEMSELLGQMDSWVFGWS